MVENPFVTHETRLLQVLLYILPRDGVPIRNNLDLRVSAMQFIQYRCHLI